MALIVITAVMAATLSAAAIAFDRYVIKIDNEIPQMDVEGAASDLLHGDVLKEMAAELQRLI